MPAPRFPSIVSPDDVAIPRPDGPALRGWHWRSPSPGGLLVIAHGLGEHAGLYRALAEYLVEALAFDVLGVDFEGHGRSPGRRGYLPRYDRLIDNLLDVCRWAARERPGVPRFLLGHSNGGVVAARAALRDPTIADGLILSNPALRLKFTPPSHKVLIGHLLRIVAPWITLGGPLPVDALSRDPLQCVLLRSDRLMHCRISAPLFFGMRDSGELARSQAAELLVPLLLILGPDDPIIDPEVGRDFFDRYGGADKTLVAPEGFRHDPLFERDRGLIYFEIARWLAPRRASDPSAAPGDLARPSSDGRSAPDRLRSEAT